MQQFYHICSLDQHILNMFTEHTFSLWDLSSVGEQITRCFWYKSHFFVISNIETLAKLKRWKPNVWAQHTLVFGKVLEWINTIQGEGEVFYEYLASGPTRPDLQTTLIHVQVWLSLESWVLLQVSGFRGNISSTRMDLKGLKNPQDDFTKTVKPIKNIVFCPFIRFIWIRPGWCWIGCISF